MRNQKFVKICLHCGSTKIKIPPAGMDLKMAKPDYCAECGHMGVFPEVKGSEIENFRKELKDEKTRKNT